MKVSEEYVAGSPNNAHSPSRGSPEPPPAEGLTEHLFRFVNQVRGPAHSLIQVYSDRIRLSARRKVAQVALAAAAALMAAVWLAAAALATMRGISGGLTAFWGGREWLGDLTGGLFALSLVAGAVAAWLRSSSHRELARLEAKYESIRNEPGKQGIRDPSTEDTDGAASS